MKKILTAVLSLVMMFTLSACGENNSAPPDSSTVSSVTTQKADKETDAYPRYTGFDGTDDTARANLQNCHILYTYDDECQGDPSSVLNGEYITCLNRQYFRTYSSYGYSQYRKGNTEYAEPDNHIAYVFKDGYWTVYDFYLKIIAGGGEPDYHENAWDDGSEVTSFSNNTLRYWELNTKTFEPKSAYGITENLDSTEVKTICGKLCNGWIQYDSVDNGGKTLDSYNYRLWVDPETCLTLRYEWYAKNLDLTDVSSVFEVSDLRLNCVSQEDFDKMIADLVESMGGESKFRKMSWTEYWEQFV